MRKSTGRLTLPSEENFTDETKYLLKRLGADALRDSDGTKLPDGIKDLPADIVTTYFVAREHNAFAKANLDERQQFYLMSEYATAVEETLVIPFTKGYFDQQIEPDFDHDPKKWWEVIDRTTGEVVDPQDWTYDKTTATVLVTKAVAFHQYTVSFLAYANWDPTSMYNHLTNDWGDQEHQIPFNAMGKASGVFMEEELERWLKDNPKTDIVRFTTFFYHFTLVFDDTGKEKFVEWFGYSGSVSTEGLLAFEKENGYALRPEDIVDEGYYNSIFRVPSKAFLDYIDFMQRYVSQKAKRLVDIVHRHGKKAIMFLGDNWIGTEPYGKYFKDIGLDGVVGSVGDGITLRLISDIPVDGFTEGRFLPYFFPDTFYPGNDPTIEGRANWITARRAILRSPVDRIGYGGYMSLAYQFPKFIDHLEQVAEDFRKIYDKVSAGAPYASAKVAVLNCWGEIRSWQPYIVAHGKWYKLSYSYMGMMEALSGMDVEVTFINFEDVKAGIDPSIDVIINAGDAYTAFSGGEAFNDPQVVSELRRFVYSGGGLIGVGEPSAYQSNGRYFQLADVFGVDVEVGFSQSTNRYYHTPVEAHFITEDSGGTYNLGENVPNVYALSENTEILEYSNGEIHMAAHAYGAGRSFYVTGLPFSLENTRLLKRAIHYVSHAEEVLKIYYAEDLNVEVAAYPAIGEYAIVNNSDEAIETIVYDGVGASETIALKPAEIRWIKE